MESRRGWGLLGKRETFETGYDQTGKTAGKEAGKGGGTNGISWRLLDDVPVLRDDRRFKVLITPAKKGTIPGHVWRSAHVVFMDDL